MNRAFAGIGKGCGQLLALARKRRTLVLSFALGLALPIGGQIVLSTVRSIYAPPAPHAVVRDDDESHRDRLFTHLLSGRRSGTERPASLEVNPPASLPINHVRQSRVSTRGRHAALVPAPAHGADAMQPTPSPPTEIVIEPGALEAHVPSVPSLSE
jgi:hypothetical protein